MADLELVNRWLERQNKDLVLVAEAASLAARVEPGLLRRLRRGVAPRSDAGLEADLWFSPLVASQNPSGFVFHAEVAALLRERLAADPERLQRAWQIIDTAHAGAPPSLRIEEEVTFLALSGAEPAVLEERLQQALYSLLQEQRKGLGQWAARALPLLPPAARNTEAARLLALAASREVGGPAVLGEDSLAGVPTEKIRAVLGDASTTFIGMRLLEDGIEFGPADLPGAKLILVPRASPVTVEILTSGEKESKKETGKVQPKKETVRINLPLKPSTAPAITKRRLSFMLGERRVVQSPEGLSEAPVRVVTALGETHLLRPMPREIELSPAALRLRKRLTAPGPKRILAIEGGGARTIASLLFLERIERLLARRVGREEFRLAEYFDLIGGGSTGGVIAVCLARGMSVAQIREQWSRYMRDVAKRPSVFWPLTTSRFGDSGLNHALAELFGNEAMESDDVTTGLCLFLKRLDTGGTWVLCNHPESRFYPQHRGITLREASRASMAAPAVFSPVELTLGDGQRGAYADAAAGNAANPAWHLLRVATSRRFPFQWPAGDDKLLLVSIGAGSWRQHKPAEEIARTGLIQWAGGLPELLYRAGRQQADEWVQALSRVLTPPGTAASGLFASTPRLSLARYDFQLDAEGLSELGLTDLVSRAEALRAHDSTSEAASLERVGEAAAARFVSDEHFPRAFDLQAVELTGAAAAPPP